MRLAFRLLFLLLVGPQAFGLDVQFRADFYQRDFAKNITTAKGNAWLKFGDQEIWAEEIEIDQSRQIATARGNVHFKDSKLDIWCDYANYSLEGQDATMEDAVMSSGRMVITGARVRRLTSRHYTVEEGTYSNCNTIPIEGKKAGQCDFDWKVYGKHLDVEVGKYLHVTDAITYISGMPVLYLPYFFFPIKTGRQSGFLQSSMGYVANLGTTVSLPYYWAMSDWSDLTITPSVHTKRGLHLGFNYRYAYSDDKFGEFDLYLLQRRFNPNRDTPSLDDPTRSRFLGLFGESALRLNNRYGLGDRAFLQQALLFVSDPFYLFDYSEDLGVETNRASLRSQLAFTWPGESTLLTTEIQHHQSMIISKDTGVDRGEVTKLPSVSYSLIATPFLSRTLLFEATSNFTNFYRPGLSYDSVSQTLVKTDKVHTDPDTSFHAGNYIREGKRFYVEPRLTANFPFLKGLQFQPTLTSGLVLYHFDVPTPQLVQRSYGDLELPLTLYISRTYNTSIKGYEKISHVVQPRFIYANRLFLGGTKDSEHPFFYRDEIRELSNPRFDLYDRLSNFEYLRLELINRLRRQTEDGAERFFLFQVSHQYNIRTIASDTRYARQFGPLEILGEFRIGRFSAQTEAYYYLEKTRRPDNTFMHEFDWSSFISYHVPEGDRFSLGNRFKFLADRSLNEQFLLFSWYKTLPLFFDILGDLEYSLLTGSFVRYQLGFLLGAKQPNCWSILINVGENELSQPFFNLRFQLDFGAL